MAPIVDLERIDGPDDGRPAHVVAESPSPRSSRRTLVALVGLVVVAVGALVLLSGGGGNDKATAPTTAPTTTVQPVETTRPRTVTTAAPGTTIVRQVGVPDVLQNELRGRSIYVFSGATVARLEIDTGVLTVVPGLLSSPTAPTDVVVRDGQLVLSQGASTAVLPADLSSEARRLDGASLNQILGSHRLFSVDYTQDAGPSFAVREYDTAGNVVTTWSVPVTAYVAGVVGDRLVLQASGRVYLQSPSGDVEARGVGDVVFVSEAALVRRECDERLECTLEIEDPITGAHIASAPVDARLSSDQFSPLLSPDARTAVLTEAGVPWLTDVVTGATLAVLDPTTTPAWSSDSHLLVARLADGHGLVAIDTRDGSSVPVPRFAAVDLDAGPVVVAIG